MAVNAVEQEVEEWRPFPEDITYEVSTLGRVRCLRPYCRGGSWKHLLTIDNNGRYSHISIGNISGGLTTFLVHRLVVGTFIRPIVKDEHVHHVNGDKHDNRLENLAIATSSQNRRYYYREVKPTYSIEDIEAVRGFGREGLSINDVMNRTGLGFTFVRAVLYLDSCVKGWEL